MLPRKEFVKIDTSEELIINFLEEVMILPRLKILEWSKKTNQTPNLKIGYPGQHLASLITGVKGVGTGARGDDIADGSEVKSCSKIDQLDTCKDCSGKVLRLMTKCPACGSIEIARKDDSKWLFAVKSEKELKLYTEGIDRIVLVLFHYPEFTKGNYDLVSVEVFEIWPSNIRNSRFVELLNHYYYQEYLPKIEETPTATPSPKNLHPSGIQFYLCNPIKIAGIIIEDFNGEPKFTFDGLINPLVDRSTLNSINMPADKLNTSEFTIIFENATQSEIEECLIIKSDYILLKDKVSNGKIVIKTFSNKFLYINEALRKYIPIRPIKIQKNKKEYNRGK